MFEFLFKYPTTIFAKGQFVFLGPWPGWVLGLVMIVAAAAIAWHVQRNRGLLTGFRPLAIWLLEAALVALVLFMLWHPAISIATLRPQQNVVAVLVDDSRSMAINEDGSTRLSQAKDLLNGPLLTALRQKFQVRLYKFGKNLERIEKPEQLTGTAQATRIPDGLRQALAEAATLPLGAVVLMSDGADNSGGIDLDTIAAIRRSGVPVHTIGFGREKFAKDIEIADVSVGARALPDSRLDAQVTFQQSGFSREKARLTVREGGKVLATQEVTFKADGAPQTESILFNAGLAGQRSFQFTVDALPGEENLQNNQVTRLVNVTASKPRILYVEGEPRWEFKFIRRGVEEDRNLQIVSMLRTTQNKLYWQGVDTADKKKLEEGFPAKPEELFEYSALIIGSVEAGYFTPAQQELIREFVNRRGGGLLFLGGRSALSEGGWAHSPLAELLPARIPETKGTFHRENVMAELTQRGRENLILRLEEKPEANAARWKKMPVIADYQFVGEPKLGAAALLEVNAGGKRSPLLVVENYGRGRTALFATGGSWRWQMMQPLADKTHEMFWQQLLRWLVSDSPGQVMASTPRSLLSDDTKVILRAEARDKSFKPISNARVEAHISGPEGMADTVELSPVPLEEGVYSAEWAADKPGSYMAEVVVQQDKVEAGRDVLIFRREDGVAENFRAAQNRELLEKLAQQTGGRYYPAKGAAKLAEEISYSEAGITIRETKDLWDMPIVFLAAILLRASEWLLRRKWGVV